MIDSKKIDTIQKKIKEAIKNIEESENVKIVFERCSYNPAHYKTQMVVTTLDNSDKIDKVYESLSKRIGFTQNIIGMKFIGKSGEFTITDIKTRNRTYPVIGVNNIGKSYKFSIDQVKTYLGGDKLINRNTNLKKLLDV